MYFSFATSGTKTEVLSRLEKWEQEHAERGNHVANIARSLRDHVSAFATENSPVTVSVSGSCTYVAKRPAT